MGDGRPVGLPSYSGAKADMLGLTFRESATDTRITRKHPSCWLGCDVPFLIC
jgi:hypothetical protein